MASFDTSVGKTEQVGCVAELENRVQGVVFELHRLQNVIAQQTQRAQNVQNNQNAIPRFVLPPPLRSASS